MSNPFGVTSLGDIPEFGMSGDELARQLGQAFTVSSDAKKAKSKTRVTGSVKLPKIKIQPKNPPSAGFVAGSAPKKAAPAKRKTKTPRPSEPRLNRETGTFTIQPVNIQALEAQAVEAKIVNTIRVPPRLRADFLSKLKDNQEKIAEFLFLQIATFDLAMPTAVEMLNEYLSDSMDVKAGVDLGQVQDMLSKISELRTLEFLCKTCGLSKAHTERLINDMLTPEQKGGVTQADLIRALRQNKTAQAQPTQNTRTPKRTNPTQDRFAMRNALGALVRNLGDM